MNNDELKARSIELAERAFRLRDRAQESSEKEKLHATGNELINIENLERFYDAQRMLELSGVWTEDQRSLAHEISVADHTHRSTSPIAISDAVDLIKKWLTPLKGTQLDANDPRNMLLYMAQLLTSNEDTDEYKEAVGYLLFYIETILRYTHEDEGIKDEMADPFVLSLRDVRDALLVRRELSYDEDQLVKVYGEENTKIDQIGLARHQLDELYKNAREVDNNHNAGLAT